AAISAHDRRTSSRMVTPCSYRRPATSVKPPPFVSWSQMPESAAADRIEELLSGLNPPQREAVMHGDGPLLILAGAGSGKTRVLTHRVAHLVVERGIALLRILAVTITNKTSRVVLEDLCNLLGPQAAVLVVSTFHLA